MLPQASRTPKLGFGPFEYDPSSGELWKYGSRVKLSSQPRLVLDALLEHPGELVARDDLRNRLWPEPQPATSTTASTRLSISSGKRSAIRRTSRATLRRQPGGAATGLSPRCSALR